MHLVDVGSLAAWLTLVTLIGTAFIVWRGGGGAAIGTLETANRVLTKRVRDLEEELRIAVGLISELRASRDLEVTIQPVLESLLRLEEASARHAATLETFTRPIRTAGDEAGRRRR